MIMNYFLTHSMSVLSNSTSLDLTANPTRKPKGKASIMIIIAMLIKVR